MVNNIQSKKYIIIIGNGFDINLGLPTGYNKFIKSPEFQVMLDRGNKLAKQLKENYELKNWIDIENELKVYSQKNEDKDFKLNYDVLTYQLIKYINNIDYSSIKKTEAAYKLAEAIAKNCEKFTVLDFNYTKSLEQILRFHGVSEELIKENLVKVHGEAANNDIIFGVEDHADIKPKHVFLRKAYPRHCKALNFKTLFEDANELIFFGHSLGETDHTYFQDLFRNSCFDGSSVSGRNKVNKIFNFFYYQEDGYCKLMQQIDELTNNNLTRFKQYNDVKFLDVGTS